MRFKSNNFYTKDTQQCYGPPDQMKGINQVNNDIEIHKFVFT